MWFADDGAGRRIEAIPGGIAYCPLCGETLIPKCGEVMPWHWAHIARTDCDQWGEGESAWHLNWKSLVRDDHREVTLRRGDEQHRADIHLPNGLTIELQQSPIAPTVIRRREAFYGHMFWIFDLSEIRDNFDFRRRDTYWSFRWKWPRQSLFSLRNPTLFDFGDSEIFELRKLWTDVPCGGWGRFIEREAFITEVLGSNGT